MDMMKNMMLYLQFWWFESGGSQYNNVALPSQAHIMGISTDYSDVVVVYQLIRTSNHQAILQDSLL